MFSRPLPRAARRHVLRRPRRRSRRDANSSARSSPRRDVARRAAARRTTTTTTSGSTNRISRRARISRISRMRESARRRPAERLGQRTPRRRAHPRAARRSAETLEETRARRPSFIERESDTDQIIEHWRARERDTRTSGGLRRPGGTNSPPTGAPRDEATLVESGARAPSRPTTAPEVRVVRGRGERGTRESGRSTANAPRTIRGVAGRSVIKIRRFGVAEEVFAPVRTRLCSRFDVAGSRGVGSNPSPSTSSASSGSADRRRRRPSSPGAPHITSKNEPRSSAIAPPPPSFTSSMAARRRSSSAAGFPSASTDRLSLAATAARRSAETPRACVP